MLANSKQDEVVSALNGIRTSVARAKRALYIRDVLSSLDKILSEVDNVERIVKL